MKWFPTFGRYVMGNHEMIETVLEAVTGHGDEVEERIYSSVMQL